MRTNTKTVAYAATAMQTSGTLQCPECGAVQPCPPKQAVEYLRIGWPKHCDQTMQLVPKMNGHAHSPKKRASR